MLDVDSELAIEKVVQPEFQYCANAYPQSWYPICFSHSLKPGKILLQHVFDRDWVLFRDNENHVGMLARHCPHMGSDLSVGKLVKGNIQCPLHHRCYDIHGKSHFQDETDCSEKLTVLPTMEKYGLIFAFWGKKPLFPIPEFNNLKNPVISAPIRFLFESPIIMMGVNTYDIGHYIAVHNRILTQFPDVYRHDRFHIGIRYEADIKPGRFYDKLMLLAGRKQVTNQIDCWGGTHFIINNGGSPIYAMAMGSPINQYKGYLFIVGACETSQSLWKRLTLDKIKSFLAARLTAEFLKGDFVALNNIRPTFRAASIRKDKLLNLFFNYWQELPQLRSE